MKYRNASEIFPDDLLKEMQKYSSGELVYIPKNTKRKTWGTDTGAGKFYRQRNEEIRYRFRHEKMSIDELANSYHLSTDTIRRILYR